MSSDYDSDADETVPPWPEESSEFPAISSIELDDLLRRRHTHGGRAARVGAFAVVALLALALVMHVAGVRLTSTPTATAHLPVGVAVLSNISFGTLTLNGRRLGGPPPQAMILRQGTNVIALTAPPFQTRVCRVTWPDLNVLGGRCTVGVGFVPELDPAIELDYEISLDFDGGDLPPNAAAAALATVNATIGTARFQTPVPVGEHIATSWTPRTGAITSVPAVQYTLARLSFTPTSTPACPMQLCTGSEFIPGFVGKTPLGVPAWMISTGVTYTWRFVTQTGTPLGSVTYPSDAPASFALIPDGDGDGGWHLWQPSTPPSPGVPQDALDVSVCDWASVFRVALPGVPSPAGVGTDVGPGVEGCAFELQAPNGDNAGMLIWRFGVLLAADDQAHRRYPALPRASTQEVEAIIFR